MLDEYLGLKESLGKLDLRNVFYWIYKSVNCLSSDCVKNFWETFFNFINSKSPPTERYMNRESKPDDICETGNIEEVFMENIEDVLSSKCDS